jgi:hypothetical protein
MDVSIQKSLSESIIKIYELMAEQHPQHRDYFLKNPEYLSHKERVKALDELAANPNNI